MSGTSAALAYVTVQANAVNARQRLGRCGYRAKLKLVTNESIAAIQVRYLTFDAWGEHGQCSEIPAALSAGENQSWPAGDLDGREPCPRKQSVGGVHHGTHPAAT